MALGLEPEELQRLMKVVDIITRTSHYERFTMIGAGSIINGSILNSSLTRTATASSTVRARPGRLSAP
jgi:hypothetical protein